MPWRWRADSPLKPAARSRSGKANGSSRASDKTVPPASCGRRGRRESFLRVDLVVQQNPLRMVESIGKEKLRYRFGELLRYPVHRIVLLTFEHDESPAGQGIHQ